MNISVVFFGVVIVIVIAILWPDTKAWFVRFVSRNITEPVEPDFTMQEAIDLVLGSIATDDDEDLDDVEKLYKHSSDGHRAALKERLLAIEKESLESDRPMRAIRRSSMDSENASQEAAEYLRCSEEDRALLEAVFGESYSFAALWLTVMKQTLIRRVLRYYAMVKYADVGEDNWFDWFQVAVRPGISLRVDAAVECARHPLGISTTVEMMDMYQQLIDVFKNQLLDAGIKTRYDLTALDRDTSVDVEHEGDGRTQTPGNLAARE